MIGLEPWVEIGAIDLDRAARFYEHVLGAELRRERLDGEEIALWKRDVPAAIVRRAGFVPAPGALVHLDAAGDIDACLARATASGGRVVLPTTDTGAMGLFAIITDSEGNAVALHQP